jgi:hypothetical protein
MPTSHLKTRNTALFALTILAAILLAAILFESGQAPIEYVLRAYVPFLAVAAIPLAYLAIALTRGPSRAALTLGVAYPAVVLFLFWRWVSAQAAGDSDSQMNITFMFIFFWAYKPWMFFLIGFVPAMLRMLVVAWRALAEAPGRKLVPILAWGFALLLFGSLSYAPARAAAEDTPQYRIDVVDNAIEPLNECLWRAAGAEAEAVFPDSLVAIRTAAWYRPLVRDGNKFPNQCVAVYDALPDKPFDVEYTPTRRDESGRARGFTLTLVERVREGGRPRIVWYDERNLRTDAVARAPGRDRVLDSVRIRPTSALTALLIAQHWVDAYAAAHGGRYPSVVGPKYRIPKGAAGVPEGFLVAPDIGACSSSIAHPAAASCFEKWDHALLYTPQVDAANRVRAYTLTLLNPTYYDNERQQPIPARTFHRDREGGLHAFGGLRPANDGDAAPGDDELLRARRDLARFLEDAARDSANALKWERYRDSVRRDSVARAGG